MARAVDGRMVHRSILSSRGSLRVLPVAAILGLAASCSGGAGDAVEAVERSSSGITVCAAGETLRGVDVSEYQGTIDWEAVAASGVSFAIARVSNGIETLDPQFRANWSGIKAAGMGRGAYQFFRASEDPVSQANLLVERTATLEPADLSPVADVELMDGESGAVLVARLAAWVARIQALTGRTPLVYASPGFWDDLPDTAQFSSLGSWVADWGPTCPDTSMPWTNWQFWQYADDGSVPGIQGAVDLDSFQGTLAQLRALGGREAFVIPSSEGGPDAAPESSKLDAARGDAGPEDAGEEAAPSSAGSGLVCHASHTRSRGVGADAGFVLFLGTLLLRRRRATLLQGSPALARTRSARGPPLRSRSTSRTARA
jgi:lysozyme